MKIQYRPTTSKVREAIFTYLGSFVNNAIMLDAFSGSGNVGITALSLGAEKCSFVEKDYSTFIKLRIDLQKRFSQDKFDVIHKDFFRTNLNSQYDLIFIDPPYHKYNSERLLKFLFQKSYITHNGIIVYEHHKTEEINPTTLNLDIWSQKKYGDTIITFLYYE